MNIRYETGYAFANIIWAVMTFGDLKFMMFSTFTLIVSLLGFALIENKKGRSRP